MPATAVTGTPREPKHRAAIASVLAAMVLVVLDASLANIALPTIGQALQVTPARSVWIVTAYQAALLMGLLPCAGLGESLGYRRVFAAGVALFTAASALCASATSLPFLLVARFLQGLGGAAVMALGVALLRVVLPPHRLGAGIGWNALAVALSSAAGPSLGAMVLSVADWRWLFAVNLPLGMLVLCLARSLPDGAGSGRSLDLCSVAWSVAAFAAFVVGAELLATRPAAALCSSAVTAVAVAVLLRRESPKENPLIPLDLLRRRSFRRSVVASICCFAGQAAAMVAMPFHLQRVLGQQALAVGFYLTAWPLTVALTAPFAGHLVDRSSSASSCMLGALCLAGGLAAAAAWPLSADPRPLVPILMLCGAGFAFFNVGNNRNMFLTAPAARSAAAGGLQGTARLLGQTSGAILTTLLFTVLPGDAAPRIGLAAAALCSLAACIVTLAHRPKVVATGDAAPRPWPFASVGGSHADAGNSTL